MAVIRLWTAVYEPRLETGGVVTAYAVAIIMALWVVLDPPVGATIVEPYLFGGMAALLLAGGSIGIPTAWLGKWYIETIAATACLGGAVLALVDVVLLESVKHWTPLSRPVLTIFATIFMVLFFAVRLAKIRSRVEAPGQGDETSVEIADRIRQDPLD